MENRSYCIAHLPGLWHISLGFSSYVFQMVCICADNFTNSCQRLLQAFFRYALWITNTQLGFLKFECKRGNTLLDLVAKIISLKIWERSCTCKQEDIYIWEAHPCTESLNSRLLQNPCFILFRIVDWPNIVKRDWRYILALGQSCQLGIHGLIQSCNHVFPHSCHLDVYGFLQTCQLGA